MDSTTKSQSQNVSNKTLIELNDAIATELIPAMIYVGILMVLGVIGNLLVCYIFSFRLRMGTQHFLIVCLAVFDLLSCFISMPTEIVDMRFFLMFNDEFACRLLRFVNSYCAFASILTLVVIAVDRFRKICRPLSRQMSLRDVKIAMVAVLFAALLFAIPAAILYGIRTTDTAEPGVFGHDCSTNDAVKDSMFPLVYNTILFVAFLILLITLSVLYAKIWIEMKRHRRYMARNSDASSIQVKGFSPKEGLSANEENNHLSFSCGGDNSNDVALRQVDQRNNVSSTQNCESNTISNGNQPNRVSASHGDQSMNSWTFGGDQSNGVTENVSEDPVTSSFAASSQSKHDGIFSDEKSASPASSQSRRSEFTKAIHSSGAQCDSAAHEHQASHCKTGSQSEINPLVHAAKNTANNPCGCIDNGDNSVFADRLNGCECDVSERCTECKHSARNSSDTTLCVHNVKASEMWCRDCVVDAIEKHNRSSGTVLSSVASVFGAFDNHNVPDSPDMPGTAGNNALDKLATGQPFGNEHNYIMRDGDTEDDKPASSKKSGPKHIVSFSSSTEQMSDMDVTEDNDGADDVNYSNSDVFHSKGNLNSDNNVRSPNSGATQCNGESKRNSSESTHSGNDVTFSFNDVRDSSNDVTHSKSDASDTNEPANRSRRRLKHKPSVMEVKNTKATIIAFSVTVVFFLSFVPHLSLITSRIIVKDFDRTLRGAALVLYNIFLRSYFVNSASNPIIYGVLNMRFRAECMRVFRQVFTCKKQPKPNLVSDT